GGLPVGIVRPPTAALARVTQEEAPAGVSVDVQVGVHEAGVDHAAARVQDTPRAPALEQLGLGPDGGDAVATDGDRAAGIDASARVHGQDVRAAHDQVTALGAAGAHRASPLIDKPWPER